MRTSFKTKLFLSAAILAAISTTGALAEDNKSVVRFSNPSEPGRLVIQIAMGDVTVTGGDVKEVTVNSESPNRANPEPRSDGLRRLDADDGYNATESGNVITITHGSIFKGGRHGGSDMNVTVPRTTAVTIERVAPGDTTLKNIAGDIEIRGTTGDVKLDGISGGVLIESTTGDVTAAFASLSETKPVSITVVHGDVALRVPVRSKANVRFRTLRGEVLTDFSEKELESRVEDSTAGDVSVDVKVDVAIEKSSSGYAKADAEKMATDARRAAADQAKAARDQAQAARDQARASADASQSASTGASASPAAPPAPPKPGTIKPPKMPKMPMIPPMSGGSVVVGALNGGGPDFIVTAVSGTITLRKVE